LELQILWYALAVLLIIVGIAGIILPVLPGLPLTFLGMLLAAWAGDFQKISVNTLILLGIITLLSLAVDFFSTVLGAKRVGASKLAVAGAAIGTIIGLFFMPLGILLGPFAGALLGELWHCRGHWQQAIKVGIGTWIGLLAGLALKLTLAFTMLGLFIFAWLF
jgi:uncharacterized protein YqgC (DUF456 family)